MFITFFIIPLDFNIAKQQKIMYACASTKEECLWIK